MDKITASAKIMSEVSPLDEFSVTLSVKFVNRMCLIKTKNAIETGITGPSTHRDRDCMRSGIFGTKRTVLNTKGSVACRVNFSVNV